MSDERGRDDRPDLSAGGADPVEVALTRALEHRAGGPVDRVGAGPEAPGIEAVGTGRFEAIEAGVRIGGAGGRTGQRLVLGMAAAAVVLTLLTAAVLRSGDDAEVHSGGGDPTTTASSVGTPDVTGPEPGTSIVGGVGGVGGATAGDPTPSETSTTAGPSEPGSPAIESVDLRNFTYPSSVCVPLFGGPGSIAPDEFTLVDGYATSPYAMPDAPYSEFGTTMALTEVLYGDVTADGVPDAVVRLACGLLASDGVAEPIVVLSMVDGAPTIVGQRSDSGLGTILDNVDPETGVAHPTPAVDHVLTVATADGHLVVRWLQGVSEMGFQSFETRRTTVTYDWTGTDFVPAGETDIEDIPAPSPQVVPVEQIDFSSIWLDLQHIRPIENTVCGWAYRDIDVASAALVDWVAPVVDGTHARVGTVRMELVTIADLDGDDASEALVRFTCEGLRPTVHTLGVYEAGPYGPYLRWTTTVEAGAFDDVTRWEVHPGQDCVLRAFFRAASLPANELVMDYRPNPDKGFDRVPIGSCAPPT